MKDRIKNIMQAHKEFGNRPYYAKPEIALASTTEPTWTELIRDYLKGAKPIK